MLVSIQKRNPITRMPATCLSFLLVADALKTPSTVSVIASLACACLSLSFILFHRFPFFHCRSIDFDSLLINFLPDIDSSLFLKIIFFSLPFSPSKKNKQTNSAIFLIFKKQNTTFCFFFSLCVCALRVWNFYFAALNYYSSSSSFLCGLFLFFFLFLSPGWVLFFFLSGCVSWTFFGKHQTMRKRRMTTIWSLSTPPTRNGRLCLSSRHYRSVPKLSNVSCQSTKSNNISM